MGRHAALREEEKRQPLTVGLTPGGLIRLLLLFASRFIHFNGSVAKSTFVTLAC